MFFNNSFLSKFFKSDIYIGYCHKSWKSNLVKGLMVCRMINLEDDILNRHDPFFFCECSDEVRNNKCTYNS